ncbi:MAG: hypothetical protein H0X17_09655 [Deltaproteobacteria bacterium]|nr:hypothetical protein [Deltaproteobacteria bacterium]
MKFFRVVVLATAAFACGGGGGFPDAGVPDGPVPAGTFSLDWALVDLQGAPISCDRVGGVTVTALLRNRAVQGGTTEVFSCGTGMGTTPLIPPGLYDIRFELTGVTGLVATAPEQTGIVISSGQNTPLAPVTFAINAIGGLDLLVDSLKSGGNCAAVASNGAGITAMTITLQHVLGGACEPATLMIGTTPYTIDCATPVEVGCIGKTTPITASGLPSDNYQIHIRGKQNALICYANDDQLRVPPNALSLMRTVNLAATGTAGCL